MPLVTGLLSRDRPTLLNLTLRSLSACVPPPSSLTIFDNASSDPHTLTYLYSSSYIPSQPFPQIVWDDIKFTPAPLPPTIQGIHNKVPVVPLSPSAVGVVNASLEAISLLFQNNPDAPAVLLLQDDILLKPDTFARFQQALSHPFPKPLGVLAGMHLNKTYPDTTQPFIESGITGQAVMITRDCFNTISFCHELSPHKNQFDDRLKRAATQAGFWCGVMMPFATEHFGFRSTVRLSWDWTIRKEGRRGYHSAPPYAVAEEVRCFK